MKCFEINNYVNEDDLAIGESCPKARSLSKMDKKLLESDRKELLKSLVVLLTSNNMTGNAINNKLTSRTEIMNLINTLRSSHLKEQFDEERDRQWETPLIEDFLPQEESEESIPENHNWINSELNYYSKKMGQSL